MMKGADAVRQAQLDRPRQLADFLAIKHDHPEAIVIAGGTVAIPLRQQNAEPPGVIHVLGLPELCSVGFATRGAATSLAALGADPAIPSALREAASSVGGPAVRAMATLGGNVVAARPGCLAVALLALDGRTDVLDGDGRITQVPLTAVVGRPDRLLIALHWNPGRPARFAKVTAGSIGPVIASVAVGTSPDRQDWRIAVGGTGMVPHRLRFAESLLPGHVNAVTEAIRAAYGPRAPIIANMVRRCVEELVCDRS